jgi:hypothetical protein
MMAGKSHRAPLLINLDDLNWLESMAKSRTQPLRKVVRAKILFRYQAGHPLKVRVNKQNHSIAKNISSF